MIKTGHLTDDAADVDGVADEDDGDEHGRSSLVAEDATSSSR